MDSLLLLIILTSISTILSTLDKDISKGGWHIKDKLLMHFIMISPVVAIALFFTNMLVTYTINDSHLAEHPLPIAVIISFVLVNINLWISKKVYKYLERKGEFSYMANKPSYSQEQAELRYYLKRYDLQSELYLAVIFFCVSLAVLFLLFFVWYVIPYWIYGT